MISLGIQVATYFINVQVQLQGSARKHPKRLFSIKAQNAFNLILHAVENSVSPVLVLSGY